MFLTPHTPNRSLNTLIWVIGLCSFITPVLSYFSLRIFAHLGPSLYLALSWMGISHLYLWQFVTYILIHSIGIGITLSLLFSIAFHLLLLWFAGGEVAYRFGKKGFWLFFISSTLIGALGGLIGLFLSSSAQVVFGSGPPVFALITIWVMCYPDTELSLFLVIRMKAKWCALGLIAVAWFIHLSNEEWPILIAEVAAVLWAYIVGHWIWKLPHPYKKTTDTSYIK